MKVSIVLSIEQPDFSELADELIPSVVSVSVIISRETVNQPRAPQFPPGSPFEDFFKDFFERRGIPRQNTPPQRPRRNETAQGSGFIIDDKGLIVTNNHVIAGASSITVVLHDGKSLQAKLIGADAKTDLALLQVKTDIKLKAVNWGDSDEVKVGNWAMAIGNPFGLVNTVTVGIVSARARDINAGPFDDFIQTDASINRGNSGGPLFNLKGQVIGVNTAILSPNGLSIGIGYSMSSNVVSKVVEQLIEYGETQRGWLGVRIQDISEDIAESLGLSEIAGALVTSVPNGPARNAGIKSGDVIVDFDGVNVNDTRSLIRIVGSSKVGKTVIIGIMRDGKKIEIKVKLGRFEEAEASARKQQENPSVKIISGLAISIINDKVRSEFQLDEELKGVIILDIDPDSKASEKGLMIGDVVVEVGQKLVQTPEDFQKQLNVSKDKGRTAALLLVKRGQQELFVALPLN